MGVFTKRGRESSGDSGSNGEFPKPGDYVVTLQKHAWLTKADRKEACKAQGKEPQDLAIVEYVIDEVVNDLGAPDKAYKPGMLGVWMSTLATMSDGDFTKGGEIAFDRLKSYVMTLLDGSADEIDFTEIGNAFGVYAEEMPDGRDVINHVEGFDGTVYKGIRMFLSVRDTKPNKLGKVFQNVNWRLLEDEDEAA